VSVGLLALNVFGLRNQVLGPRTEVIASLAVLPLENLSGDSNQEYLIDGIHDELITRLGQIRSLRVIGRTSVLRYKGGTKTLRDIERELGVEAILEGSVQRMGNRVRLTARLISMPTERQLWTGSYEGELRDVLALQNDIVRAIATELKITVPPQVQARFKRAPTVNREAQEAYYIGRYNILGPERASLPKAIQYFEQAIERDPNYATAYASLALTYLHIAVPGSLLPPKEALLKAQAAAEKALKLDDTLAEAHEALGWIRMYFNRDWQGAEKAFKRSRDFNPSLVGTGYAYWLIAMGKFEEAVAEMERVRELEPLATRTTNELARINYFGRKYDRAIQLFQASLERDSTQYVTHLWLGWTYLQKGMHDEAVAEIVENKHLAPRAVTSLYVTNVYAVAGKREQAQKILGEVIELSKKRFVHALIIARTYVALGEKDQAFAWLDKAYEQYEYNLIHLNDPLWDPVRDDPRFRALLRRMNLPH
jgi:TolB-like protein/Tfp pilus assembly protein PilF